MVLDMTVQLAPVMWTMLLLMVVSGGALFFSHR